MLGVDWGASINCLTVNQALKNPNELRTLKSMYVLGDDKKTQEDLFNDFDEYYKPHQATCKTVYLWCDNSGNNRTGITKLTRAQLAVQQLQTKGWEVRIMTIGGSNPLHEDKHVLWNLILSERDARYPKYTMNRHNCTDLWISMTYARAIASSTGVKKDKAGERSKTIQRNHATDLSDAMDTVVYGLYSSLLRGIVGSQQLPGIRT